MNEIILTNSRFEIDLNAETLKLKSLEKSRLITSVTDDSQKSLIEALKDLKWILKHVEEARVAAKKPALDFSRQVDAKAKDFSSDLILESDRIENINNKFESEKILKARIEEERRQAELKRIQDEQRKIEEQARRDREEAELKLIESKNKADREKTLLEMQKKEEENDLERQRLESEKMDAQTTVVKVEEKIQGKVVKKVWKYKVTDIHAVYAFNKNLCRIEENKSEFNKAMDLGLRECPGATIWSEIDTSVRI